jgi:Holliday junction resolvase-like predicted endonuclease
LKNWDPNKTIEYVYRGHITDYRLSRQDSGKRRRLITTADDYVRALSGPLPKWRFDVVEVLMTDGEIQEFRHLPNAFPATLAGLGGRKRVVR